VRIENLFRGIIAPASLKRRIAAGELVGMPGRLFRGIIAPASLKRYIALPYSHWSGLFRGIIAPASLKHYESVPTL